MKKVVSLLVALATAVGVSVSALAASDDNGIYGSRTLLSDRNTVVGYGASLDNIQLVHNQLLIVENNASESVILPETPLDPGTEYEFRIYYAVSDSGTAGSTATDIRELTDAQLGGRKLQLRGIKGTSTISSAKINKKGSGDNATYRLVINTKDIWNSKLTDVEYTLRTTGSINSTATKAIDLVQADLSFQVGYGQWTDEEIDALGDGDTVVIDNDFPVILKKQMETIAKVNNYKAVQFEAEDGMWSYLGRISGMGDTNFRYTRDVIPAIVDKFEDQEFEFLTFNSGVTFPANGEMRIDVSDFSSDYDRMYTYLYRNGKLTPISTSYDTGSDELVFRTNFLGSFVITDEQITDTTIIEIDEGETPTTNPDDNTNVNPENPSTGASGMLNAALLLGTVSLATAAVTRKKK